MEFMGECALDARLRVERSYVVLLVLYGGVPYCAAEAGFPNDVR